MSWRRMTSPRVVNVEPRQQGEDKAVVSQGQEEDDGNYNSHAKMTTVEEDDDEKKDGQNGIFRGDGEDDM